MSGADWIDLGPVERLRRHGVQEIEVAGGKVALTWADGVFAALGGTCPHAGGPLGEGALKDGCLVCPWHSWTFDRLSGANQAGAGAAGVATYRVEEREGHVWIDPKPSPARTPAPVRTHPLAREIVRAKGPMRVVGISTTVMNAQSPRYSTSEKLLGIALDHASGELGAETRLIRLNDLRFRACEGYYSRSAESCTWPCTITQADPEDGMEQVYEALVHWADVVLVATPIRWGVASSLYFRMAERMNCIQNQITIHDRVLIRNKVAAFVITGGQDNIQAVAGQMLTFFAELGFQFPQFPFIAHSRGWSAEDMEANITHVEKSAELHEGAQALVARAVDMAAHLVGRGAGADNTPRGGRKACPVREGG